MSQVQRTFGNVDANGSHVDRATTPPNRCGEVKARIEKTHEQILSNLSEQSTCMKSYSTTPKEYIIFH